MTTGRCNSKAQGARALQIYSKYSRFTHELLKSYGITEIARSAGIDEERILAPLPATAEGTATGKRLGDYTGGKELVVRHRTTLSAAQNIAGGALWMSNGKTYIGGKRSLAVYGPGLYAAKGTDALGYGAIYVEITLDPNAREGIDYEKKSDYYVIRTERAIARNQGRLKIAPVTREGLLTDFTRKLEAPVQGFRFGLSPEETSLVRGIATLTTFESNAVDETRLLKLTSENKYVREPLYTAIARRPGMLKRLLASPSSTLGRSITAFVAGKLLEELGTSEDSNSPRFGADRLTKGIAEFDALRRLVENPDRLPFERFLQEKSDAMAKVGIEGHEQAGLARFLPLGVLRCPDAFAQKNELQTVVWLREALDAGRVPAEAFTALKEAKHLAMESQAFRDLFHTFCRKASAADARALQTIAWLTAVAELPLEAEFFPPLRAIAAERGWNGEAALRAYPNNPL